MRDLQSRADALTVAGWMEDVEPPARRAFVRRHYRQENAVRERTETRVWEIRKKIEAARDLLGSAADLMAREFSELRAETPALPGKFDGFFVTFISEFADFWETVTGKAAPPNGKAFEELIGEAHRTLIEESAHLMLSAEGAATWDHRRAAERQKSIAAAGALNSKIRNALARRAAERRAFQAGNS